jgi:aryl-alcohol dehydrogenase-like predicted oxidoreductase
MASIQPIAERHGATLAQIVIAWTVQQPGITFSLCGARDRRQAEENAAAGRIRLSADEISEIDTQVRKHLNALDT